MCPGRRRSPARRDADHPVKYAASAPGFVSSETPTPEPEGRSFLDRIGQGWELARVSLRVVRRRKRIVLFPVLGFLALVSLLGTFVGGTIVALGLSLEQLPSVFAALIVLDLGLNIALYFLLVLLNAAIAVFALELFDGRTPKVFGSVRRTLRGGRPLFVWALIAAAVSTAIHLVQVLVPTLNIPFAVAGFVWTFFVPLVAPIVLFEGLGPFGAMRRSTRIRRGTWVEGVSGLVSVYVMFILLGLLAVLPPLVGYLIAGTIGLAIGLIPSVIYLIPLFFAGTTTKSVLVAVVYRYGTTGEIPGEFRGTALQTARSPRAAEGPR